MSDKIKRRIFIALFVSVLIHISFLVWSYFLKILPVMPLPEKPSSVFHVRLSPKDSERVSEGLDTLFEFAGYTGAPVTGIVDTFKDSSLKIIKYTADIINEMCDDCK